MSNASAGSINGGRASRALAGAAALAFSAAALWEVAYAARAASVSMQLAPPVVERLFFAACFGAAAVILWRRVRHGTAAVWVITLLCLAKALAPVLTDPTRSLFGRGGARDLVTMSFVYLSFAWATALLLVTLHRAVGPVGWPMSAGRSRAAALALAGGAALEAYQAASAYAALRAGGGRLEWEQALPLWAGLRGSLFYAAVFAVAGLALWRRGPAGMLVAFAATLAGLAAVGLYTFWSEWEVVRVVLASSVYVWICGPVVAAIRRARLQDQFGG